MNEHDLYRAMSHVGDDLIAENAHRPARKPRFAQWRTLAACLALVLLCGAAVGGYAAVYEANEYRVAIAFFEEYNLPADGLTRAEMQAVYQDIEQGTFAHPKTAEVFNVLSYRLYMAPLAATDQDSLKAFWENRTYAVESSESSSNLRYVLSNERPIQDGLYVTSGWSVCCYDGDLRLWSYALPMSSEEEPHVIVLEDGVLVYGRIHHSSIARQSAYAGAVRIDGDGAFLWDYSTREAGSDLDTAILEGDELVLLGRVRWDCNETLYVRLDLRDGHVLQTRKTRLDGFNSAYQIAIPYRDDRCGDGYLLENSNGKLAFISASDGGAVAMAAELPRYTDKDGTTYTIMDMLAKDDRVFLLGYRYVDPEKDAALLEQVREMERDGLWASNAFGGIQQEAYTDIFRSLLTTALFVSEADGTLRPVYTAAGAAPSAMLSLDDDGHILLSYSQLNMATPPNPAISASCFMADMTAVELAIDSSGRLLYKNERPIGEQQVFY